MKNKKRADPEEKILQDRPLNAIINVVHRFDSAETLRTPIWYLLIPTSKSGRKKARKPHGSWLFARGIYFGTTTWWGKVDSNSKGPFSTMFYM